MALEDIKRELRRQGEIWAKLRVLAKDSLAAEREAAKKAAAKETAQVKFTEVVQRARGGLAEVHCQQDITQRSVGQQAAQVVLQQSIM